MTDVIKYSNGAIRGLSDLERIANQIKDRRNNGLVIVVTPLGDTTDRVGNVLRGYSKNSTPQQVFGIYDALVNQIRDPQLRRNVETIYRQFQAQLYARTESQRRNQNGSRDMDEMLLAMGYDLTAHISHTYLLNAGIESRLIGNRDDNFPLIIEDERKSTSIDMKKSREAAQGLRNGVVIVPGYTRTDDGSVRTLGIGGSDIATFALSYALGAKSVWIVDDALTVAPFKDRYVEEIDLDEAWAAGFFGARLKTHRCVEYLSSFLEEFPHSQAFLTGMDIGRRKTRINPQAKEQATKFIASKHVELYGIRGDPRGLLNILYRTPEDWFIFGGTLGEVGVGAPESGGHLVGDIVRYSERRGEVKIEYYQRRAYLGVVGSGMRRTKGIAERAYGCLRRINILRTHDSHVSEPNSSSIGIMVDLNDEQQALQAFHKEFFGR